MIGVTISKHTAAASLSAVTRFIGSAKIGPQIWIAAGAT
jgi:hypothetical protein